MAGAKWTVLVETTGQTARPSALRSLLSSEIYPHLHRTTSASGLPRQRLGLSGAQKSTKETASNMDLEAAKAVKSLGNEVAKVLKPG
jgi:hypothetical protein